MKAKIIIEVGDDSTKIEMTGSGFDLVKGTSMALWSALSGARKPGVSDAELIEEAKIAVIAAAVTSRRAEAEKTTTEIDAASLKKALEAMGR